MTISNHCLTEKEIALLRSLIGKKILSFRHEKFVILPISFGLVGIKTEDGLYKITSALEDCDLMGEDDEAGFLGVDFASETDFVKDPSSLAPFINSEVGQTLQDIVLIHQIVDQFEGEEKISTLHYTKGILFVFETKEYCFTQMHYYFEDIQIDQGHDLLEKLPSWESEWKDLRGEETYTKCSRTLEHLK